MEYNLIEERWIPILRNNGKYDHVGIKDALAQAGSIRQIAASNPMDRVAILRFLLALLYWCKGNPPDNAYAVAKDSFPADWFPKLNDHKDCFNLLGDGKRFYQCRASGPGEHKKLSVNYLVQEIPTGTNMWHFRHSTDNTNGLCPDCCVMGLLRLPLFATSGGRGKPPGVNSKPPIYVIPLGMSLAQTLLLSWRQVLGLGTPAWEKPDQQIPGTGEAPLLMGLTWLPRRVWLDNPEAPENACISCGRKERLIRRSVFAGIGSTKTAEGGPSRIWHDPHVIYAESSKGEVASIHASNVLSASDAAASQWAKIVAGMIQEQKAFDHAINVWVVGFATVQNDKYLEAMECMLPPPASVQQIQESIEKIAKWQKAGSSLVRDIRPQNEKSFFRRKHVEIPPMVAAIRPHVEGKVSNRIGELLAGGDEAWQQAAAEYQPMMKAIARSLFPGFTTAALKRRRHIEGVMPVMRPMTETTEKSGRKKGGNK